MEFVVRTAGIDHAESILALITDKSIYDHCADELELTLDDIHRDFFGRNPKIHALLAFCEGVPVGIATYSYTYSTFKARQSIWLDDLYIKENNRQFGLGHQLIRKLAEIAKEKGCCRIDWIVYQDNDIGLSFYKKLGARIYHELSLGRLDAQSIGELTGEKETAQ